MRATSIVIGIFSLLPLVSPAIADSETGTDTELKIEQVEELKELNPLVYEGIPATAIEGRTYSGVREKRKKKSYSRNYIAKETEHNRTTWKPTFESGNNIQPKKSLFFRTDVGVGLLYFKNARANFQVLPAYTSSPLLGAHLREKLTYNRTPLYEYQVGYRFNPYFQLSLAYVHQGDIAIETKKVYQQYAGGLSANAAYSQFSANLNLDAILLKIYTEGPCPLMINNIMANIFLGTGIGAGWQSWTQPTNNSVGLYSVVYLATPTTFRSKTSANFVWMSDVGVRMQRATSQSQFSLLGGVKFNIWGQARSLGKLTQQGNTKYALAKPLTIETIYQWSPYLGVQWNFPTDIAISSKKLLNRCDSPLLTQMNVGVGMLYFKKVRGNLDSRPPFSGTNNDGWVSAPVNTKIRYNRTPLYEFLVQKKITDGLQLGVSYQNQGGVAITATSDTKVGSNVTAAYTTLSSHLNLNAVLLKGYFKWLVHETT